MHTVHMTISKSPVQGNMLSWGDLATLLRCMGFSVGVNNGDRTEVVFKRDRPIDSTKEGVRLTFDALLPMLSEADARELGRDLGQALEEHISPIRKAERDEERRAQNQERDAAAVAQASPAGMGPTLDDGLVAGMLLAEKTAKAEPKPLAHRLRAATLAEVGASPDPDEAHMLQMVLGAIAEAART